MVDDFDEVNSNFSFSGLESDKDFNVVFTKGV